MEALSPTNLIPELRAGLEAAVDLRLLAAARERSAAERAEAQQAISQLPGSDT
ncbi:hypothetical protein ABZ502_17295 [Streptomyces abikoensis]|uniref:hypothetical protein n=1 Tax=Streptomyces abikoensis TaxID=97398 RepID=UPI0033F671B7